MHLVQLFLPVTDNGGRSVSKQFFTQVTTELTERFGGMTAYARAPASGLWSPDGEAAPRLDELFVVEVVVDAQDRTWWRQYVERIEAALGQQRLHVRCWSVDLLKIHLGEGG